VKNKTIGVQNITFKTSGTKTYSCGTKNRDWMNVNEVYSTYVAGAG